MEDLGKTLLGLGVDPKGLNSLQVSLRAIIIFAATIAIVRVGEKRFLAQRTAYDAVLAFILASMLSRAINGSAAILPTLAAGFTLVVVHRVLSYWAARSHRFGSLLKGHDIALIKNGNIEEEALREHHISRHDLQEDIRLHGVDSPEKIKEARLERSGEISVIKKDAGE